MLEVTLREPACDLYPSQHQDVTDNNVRILFNPQLHEHVAHATDYTFHFAKVWFFRVA